MFCPRRDFVVPVHFHTINTDASILNNDIKSLFHLSPSIKHNLPNNDDIHHRNHCELLISHELAETKRVEIRKALQTLIGIRDLGYHYRVDMSDDAFEETIFAVQRALLLLDCKWLHVLTNVHSCYCRWQSQLSRLPSLNCTLNWFHNNFENKIQVKKFTTSGRFIEARPRSVQLPEKVRYNIKNMSRYILDLSLTIVPKCIDQAKHRVQHHFAPLHIAGGLKDVPKKRGQVGGIGLCEGILVMGWLPRVQVPFGVQGLRCQARCRHPVGYVEKDVFKQHHDIQSEKDQVQLTGCC